MCVYFLLTLFYSVLVMATVTPCRIGGYDNNFVNTPHNRFICKICHLPSRHPYLSVCCGHLFCKSCLDNFIIVSVNACPICRDENFVTFPNKAIDREVKGLHIYCTNKEKGCEWQGELNDIINHLENSDGCQFEEVKCSNECGKMMERRYLTNHVETECPRHKVNCKYCHDTGEHQFIEGQHKEECPKLPLSCPNKCEVVFVLREDMESHRKECPLEMIQCEYFNVGCKRDKFPRKDLENHKKQKREEHLIMTKNELTNTKLRLDDTKAKLDDTKDQLDAALKQISSLAVLMNAQLHPGSSITDVRSTQLDAMVTMFKFTCPVTIKMEGYNEKKVNKIQWHSEPFYTHDKGYRICLKVYAAGIGNGRGTHLSVFLSVIKGLHDDELTWPLRGKFEIKLLNQVSDSRHHSVIVTYDDDTPAIYTHRVLGSGITQEAWGRSLFISNEDLLSTFTTCQYVMDGCLYFQVIKL